MASAKQPSNGPYTLLDGAQRDLESLQAWRPRRWRGHWLAFWGEGSAEDAVACCLAWSLPACAYGWNVSKVLRLNFWAHMLLYVALLAWGKALLGAVDVATMRACMPVLPPPGGAGAEPSMPLTPADAHACAVLRSGQSSVRFAVGLFLWFGALVWAVAVGGRRRREMREALGIPVSPAGQCCSPCHCNGPIVNDDCCLHCWCTPCALAQETRTILHEEATGGLPGRLVGEAQGVPVVAAAAPAGQQGMQRATAVPAAQAV